MPDVVLWGAGYAHDIRGADGYICCQGQTDVLMISGGADGYSFRDWLRFLLLTHGLSAPALRKLALRAQTCDRRRCQCVRPDESLAMSSQICIRLPLAVMSCRYGFVVMSCCCILLLWSYYYVLQLWSCCYAFLLYPLVMAVISCNCDLASMVLLFRACCYAFFFLYNPDYFLYNFYREIYWEVEIYVC